MMMMVVVVMMMMMIIIIIISSMSGGARSHTWPEYQLTSLNFFVSFFKRRNSASEESKTAPLW